MEVASKEDKRKSFFIATLIYVLLLVLLFFIRFWPPSDVELAVLAGGGGGGVTVNFGDSDFGSGDNYKSDVLEVKEVTKQTPSNVTPDENIISDDNNADKTDVVIPKNDKPKIPKPIIKKEVKPIIEKPKVNSNANSALNNIIKGNKGGDGNNSGKGNQGSTNGDINSNGYGNGGSGTGTGGGNGSGTGVGSGNGTGGGNGTGNGKGVGSGYSLSGRKALSIPKPSYDCNEEGAVVVQITVDKNGKTIDAKPGYRGTTNTASCLASQAKIAAMNAKWDPSPTGAEKQVGTITYNFSRN